jgi:hypothetical protein
MVRKKCRQKRKGQSGKRLRKEMAEEQQVSGRNDLASGGWEAGILKRGKKRGVKRIPGWEVAEGARRDQGEPEEKLGRIRGEKSFAA